jgi:hypothetical protein
MKKHQARNEKHQAENEKMCLGGMKKHPGRE